MLSVRRLLLTFCRLVLVTMTLLLSATHSSSLTTQPVTEIKSLSQCYSVQSLISTSPTVLMTLYCGHGRTIAVRRVVNGYRRHVHRNINDVRHCGFIDGDCLTDVIDSSFANWTSSCNNRRYCVQTAVVSPDKRLKHLEQTSVDQVTSETLSDCQQIPQQPQQQPVYLLIFYECLEDSTKAEQVENSINESVDAASNSSSPYDEVVSQSDAVNICSNYSTKSTEVTMVSPGYPHSYPPNVDCRCLVRARQHSKVSVRYKDIELTMSDQLDQCVDWLLLQSIGYRNSAAMTCGHLSGADRVIASRGHQLMLHFHTAPATVTTATDNITSSNDRRMKGFRIVLQADPVGEFRVHCHLATVNDLLSPAVKLNAASWENEAENTMASKTGLLTRGNASGSAGCWFRLHTSALSVAVVILLTYY